MTFNGEGEFLSLFVRGYKTAESRDSLVVANLALKQQPWVAFFCKTPPNPSDKIATKEHEDEIIRVKKCLQGQHCFESQEECQWALKPPTNVKGFVSGKIWAITRVGDTSDVRKVEKQRLYSLLLDEARSKYSEIAGFWTANEMKNAHEHHDRGLGVNVQATVDYMENTGIFVTRYDKWFDTTANVIQDDGSRIVRRLKQTCTPTRAARKWVTTVTDVMILNAVGLDVLVMERNAILRACGLVNCRLTVCLYRFSPCR